MNSSRLLHFFKNLYTRGVNTLDSPTGKKLTKVIRYFFLIVILSLILYQLSKIGWLELWTAMPRTIWFYLIFLVLYFSLPITEQFIYRMSLDFSFWEGFKVFTKKKVLNQEVIGYSGEAYFYLWAKKNLKESSKHILQIVKDNTIISALASTLTALVLLTIFAGVINLNLLDEKFLNKNTILFGSIILIVVTALLYRFRSSIISVDRRTAWKMFFTHELRIFWVYTLEIIQWMIVIPSVPLFVWFTFLSVKIITSRIPLLPNRDLLFISASLEISKHVDIGEAAIAGILLTSNILTKILNLIFFVLFSIGKEDNPKMNKVQLNDNF